MRLFKRTNKRTQEVEKMTIKIEDFAFGNQQPSIERKPNHQLSSLSEEELQGVVGGQVSERAIIFEPDGTVIKTEPGDVVQTPGGSVVTTFPLENPFR